MLVTEYSTEVSSMTKEAAEFFWQRDTFLLEREDAFRACEMQEDYQSVREILEDRLQARLSTTRQILGALRIYLIQVGRLREPRENFEEWLQYQYEDMCLQDRLQDSPIACLEEEDLKDMYDMGKPQYLNNITMQGINTTGTPTEATGYLRRYLRALDLSREEMCVLEGTDVEKSKRMLYRYEVRMPPPIDIEDVVRCDEERQRIFRIMDRKRILVSL
jgi:hypothetical protein